jgi:hypothetical protein
MSSTWIKLLNRLACRLFGAGDRIIGLLRRGARLWLGRTEIGVLLVEGAYGQVSSGQVIIRPASMAAHQVARVGENMDDGWRSDGVG